MKGPALEARVTRRSFLGGAACGAAALFLRFPRFDDVSEDSSLRFGLVADVHQDVMHDAVERIHAFVETMNSRGSDFICQLGDFCQPNERNGQFIDEWNRFEGPCRHVLGNHDMDGGYTREQTAAFYGMPGSHYSFDQKGVHCIVLDGNDPGGKTGGYKRFVAKEQAEWLAADLAGTELPSVVLSHQPLDHPGGIENGEQIRKILQAANHDSKARKVVACFSGHLHQDYVRNIGGILYAQINSASYFWLPRKFVHRSYPDAIHDAYPWIEHTAPYRDPLWALVTIDLHRGVLAIEGRRTEWVGPDPWKLSGSDEEFDRRTIAPRISDWRIPV